MVLWRGLRAQSCAQSSAYVRVQDGADVTLVGLRRHGDYEFSVSQTIAKLYHSKSLWL